MTLLASLSNRIFLATAILAVVSMSVAIAVVNQRVTREAEAELERGLTEAGTLVDEQRRVSIDSFARIAGIVADLPRLKAAVDTGDAPTVQLLARDYLQPVRSDLFVVTDRGGRTLARAGRASVPGALDSMATIRAALAGREASGFWPEPGGVLQVVTVPIWIDPEHPEILGTLTVGLLLDDDVARRFKELTASEIAFVAGGRVLASTLALDARRQLEQALGGDRGARVSLGGDEFVLIARALSATNGGAGTSGAVAADARGVGAPVVVVLRSRSERLRFLRAIHAALGATAIVTLLVATLVSYLVARTMTRPLSTITSAMREMAATGDLARRIALPTGRLVDEDARLLAATFNTLTESVTRFQREAAVRERLSALGRLSTVVAHEVRNPLMIIKASLRTLRKEAPAPQEIRETADDIDGEVARLNRVVNDVLDFARPIRFELGQADLNTVCAGAAASARAADPGVEIDLVLAPGLPVITTDAERLRAALVNLLTNARHAVVARRSAEGPRAETGTAAPGGPDIRLSTSPAGPDVVAVTVLDRGAGIEASDLARVFDPFFTTRRTGTGLGLPITRNIVEGLGGTITIESQPGIGTEARVELPLAPPGRPPAPDR